jgi:Haem-dependent oxidative N-demethylase, alpha subunit-like
MAAAMNLNSSNTPIYLPDSEQSSVLRLGFENCATEDWIFPACDLNRFHRHKIGLHDSQQAECTAESSGSEDTQHEFHDFLLQHLLVNKKLGYAKSGDLLTHKQAGLTWQIQQRNLWQASLWIPEDICLLEASGDRYVMTAASVCSPSNWVLREKIGQTVDFIHEPVPDYDKVLSQRVNRFLSGLGTERVMLRYNWSIQAGNELFWRDDLKENITAVEIDNPNAYWRIERQTFIRLPDSGAIVFGIRLFLHSFAKLQLQSGFNESVTKLVSQLPEKQRVYKGLT